jgi:hypothetical protein
MRSNVRKLMALCNTSRNFRNGYHEWSITLLVKNRAHSFGYFEKRVLFNSRTFTSRLKSAGPEKREVVPRAVKSARYPVLLGKSRTFDKIVQN